MTASLTRSHPRNLLSIATLKSARSRRLPAGSSRARMAHTLFGKQRSFLTDDPPLVPGFAFWGDCGKLDSWHNMPSDPPSLPRHQHSADDRNIALVLMAVVRSLGNAVSLQVHSTALSHSDGCCTVNECQLSFSRLLSTQTNTELSKHRQYSKY